MFSRVNNWGVMKEKETTGIFLNHPGNGHVSKLDFTSILEYTKAHEEVAVVWDSNNFQVWDVDYLKTKITENKLTRIIIAGYDTGLVKSIFSRAFSSLNLNVENIVLNDFKEHGVLGSGTPNWQKLLFRVRFTMCPWKK